MAMEDVTPGAQLMRLGDALSAARRPRAAALVYLSAGSGSASGLSPERKAEALVAGANALLRVTSSPDLSRRPSDTVACAEQARSALLKACLLLDKCAGAEIVEARLSAGALLETACVRSGARSRGVLDACFTTLRKRAATLPTARDWWLYFKGREVDAFLREHRSRSNAALGLSAGGGAESALKVADSTADDCDARGDHLAAAAFRLVEAQICLSCAGSTAVARASAAVDRSRRSIDTYHRTSTLEAQQAYAQADAAMLKFSLAVVHALLCLRQGQVCRANALQQSLSESFDAVARTSSTATPGRWKWQSRRVLQALVQHVLALTALSRADAVAARQHATSALERAGFSRSAVCSARASDDYSALVFFDRKLPAVASRAFGIVLLDTAARVHLLENDLPAAEPFVTVALHQARGVPDPAHPDHFDANDLPLATQAGAYLLASEYFLNRGTRSDAETATGFLDRILEGARTAPEVACALCDITHMARTYMSLLTGEQRLDVHQTPNLESPKARLLAAAQPYESNLVLAAALFAEGIWEMRSSRVVESRVALEAAADIIALPRARDTTYTENLQLAANVMTTLGGLFLAHQTVPEDMRDIITNSVAVAKRCSDPTVTLRALRTTCKMLERTGAPPEQLERLAEARHAAEVRVFAPQPGSRT